MREARGKKSVVVWQVEVGKGKVRKKSPKALNQAPKRNPDLLLPDFIFELTIKVTGKLSPSRLRSQIVILSRILAIEDRLFSAPSRRRETPRCRW